MFKENIKNLRKAKKINQEELAKIIGVSVDTIRRYESGEREPRIAELQAIAAALNTTAAALMGEADVPAAEISNASHIDDVLMVPVVSSLIQVSAGNGNIYPQIDWEIAGYMPVPRSELIAYSWQGAKFNIITADGDSMEPYISDGDKLLFAEGVDVGPGEVAVVSYDGALLVKGVLQNKDGTVTLISFNKDFKDRIIDPAEHDFYILGKALRVVSSKRIPGTI